ncbi:amino-acid N-acetyltransferase [Gryllotalpicola sp.]|uniref:amino-acid N-acetyltransferase n=1 Tax=Gryllotalpicola sp. TaxID=1932787 RepID=UPI00260AD4E5|nr:amino-acid N-acetyltransferase [Gryllotalpicola sp.]
MPEFAVRPARTQDVRAIRDIIEPYVAERILLGKELVTLYEAVPEFRVAETPDGEIVGIGALHVIWEDLGEVRTLAAKSDWRGRGIGHAVVDRLEADARALGLSRLFCLTFETDFFAKLGYTVMAGGAVDPELYAELLRSQDEGVAEFLDLARVKQNTLGNTRMIKHL